MTKLHGKFLVITWDPDNGGDTLSISAKSRNWKMSQKGNEIDVSVREDIAAGQKDFLVDAPDRTATLAGLDTDENAPDWRTLEIGDTGTLREYRRGNSTGLPYREWDATVTSGPDLNSPHDNVNDWSIEWKLTSATSSGVVS